MIQRVQSIYLLLVTVLMSFMLIRPYAEVTTSVDQLLVFRSHAIIAHSGEDATEVYRLTLPVILLVLATGLLSFYAIFFYGKRIIQIRLCITSIFLLLALILAMIVYYGITKSAVTELEHRLKLPMIFPVLGIVFCVLATRAIQRDEMLVNSYNRIR